MAGDDFDCCSEPFPTSFKHQWADFYSNLTAALAETNETCEMKPPPEKAKLSAYTLRRDIRRCSIEAQPYFEMLMGLADLFTWKNPIASMAVFVVYMYAVYRGLLASFFFFTILLQLGLNYIAEHKNVHVGLYFLPKKHLPETHVELSGAQLVFDVARHAQIFLTFVVDLLEKTRALFTWQRPKVTFNFLCLMAFFFVGSVSCSTATCLSFVGYMLGAKAFIATYLYHRFPRLRSMFDIVVYFYDRLPTSRSRETHEFIEKCASCSTLNQPADSSDNSSRVDGISTNSSFSKVSSNNGNRMRRLLTRSGLRKRSVSTTVLETTKTPTEADQNSDYEVLCPDDAGDAFLTDDVDDMFVITRSCTILDKNSTFPRGVAAGTLVLSDKMIGFQYQKPRNGSREMIRIPFANIIAVRKMRTMKTFTMMPGTSKSLELRLFSKKKPVQFVGIQKRDDFYESLIQAARLCGVELGLDDSEN